MAPVYARRPPRTPATAAPAVECAMLDVRALLDEIDRGPPLPPPVFAVSIAIIDDVSRLAGLPPVPDGSWALWRAQRGWPGLDGQAAALAHWLVHTSLRTTTVAWLTAHPRDARALEAMFEALGPVPGDALPANAFRREEVVRRWAEAWGLPILGEARAQSERRLEQLDYRKALGAFTKAEGERRAAAEAARRAAAEAAARAAESQGYRE